MIDVTLKAVIADMLNCRVGEVRLQRVMGGDINQSFRADLRDGRRLFVKTNSCIPVLQSEYRALTKLNELGVDYYPEPIGFHADEKGAYLAMPFLSLQSLKHNSAPALASALFNQHLVRHAKFGWYEDGHIGHSKQCNPWAANWPSFFIDFRLKPQLSNALSLGLSTNTVDTVETVMEGFAARVDLNDIQPCLLHGDLWSGNLAYNDLAEVPALFDPAPYYGDSEADVAMTLLFGRFPDSFYQRYRELKPEPDDFQYRCSVYNLYHALNHVNLFGLGYESLVVSLCNSALKTY